MRYALLAVLVVSVSVLAACTPEGPKACPEDATVCADGSVVGRTGPNCEFICPEPAPSEIPAEPAVDPVTQKTESAKRYIGTSNQQCMVIRFVCAEGEQYFQDEQGCGCRYDEVRFVINEHLPAISPCTLEYNPVCGYGNNEPKTFGNSCAARTDASVTYYVQGECPAKVQEDSAEPSKPVAEPVEDGTCDPNNRPTTCSKILSPVCGSDGKTYGNPCSACASKYVDAYEYGRCGSTGNLPFLATRCTAEIANKDCTQRYEGQVCGYQSDKTKTTFENKCVACQNEAIEYYLPGACAQDTKSTTKAVKTKYGCPAVREQDCPDTPAEVCGYIGQESRTYTNSCLACREEAVTHYYQGSC